MLKHVYPFIWKDTLGGSKKLLGVEMSWISSLHKLLH